MLHTQLIFAHNLPPPKQKILDETLTSYPLYIDSSDKCYLYKRAEFTDVGVESAWGGHCILHNINMQCTHKHEINQNM